MSNHPGKWTALLLLCAVAGGCGKRDQERPRLILLCAAGMREPVSKAAQAFEDETGVMVDIQFGGSGTLLATMNQVKADLYLAADRGYIEEAAQRGLVVSRHAIGSQSPVLAWNANQVFEVGSLSAWAKTASRPGMAIPETAAIGKVTEEVLKAEGVWKELKPHAEFVTVYELANAIQLGAVDSGIIWDNVASGYQSLSVQRFPELDEIVSEVEVAVLLSSQFSGAATQLAEFFTDRKGGGAYFKMHGVKTEAAP